MNYYVIIPLVAVIINVIITTYVFAQSHKSPVNQAYILLCLFFIGWMVLDIFIWSPIEKAWILPLLKAQSAIWLSVGLAFTHFSYVFLRRNRDIMYYLFLFALLVAVPIALSSDLFIKDFARTDWGVSNVGGPLFAPIAFVVTMAPFLYSLGLLYQRTRRTNNEIEKKQLVLVLAGTGIAVLVIVVTALILPEFFGVRPLPLTHTGILIHLGFIFVAIIKYKFFSIGIEGVADYLFSGVRTGVVIVNNSDEVVQINEAARKMFGIPVDGNPTEAISSLIRQYKGQSTHDEYETTLENGSAKRPVRIARSPVRQFGEEIGSIIFVSDLSRQKKAEQEIRRANADLAAARDQALNASRTKSDFLANMSHELRTPLNAIIGYSEMLREETENSGQTNLTSDLQKIHTSGHHLLTLINDILDLSKIEAGKMELYLETFDIPTLMDEIVTTVRPLMDQGGNTLSVHCPHDLGEMKADITKVRQALFNLLSNASKFTDRGIITLSVSRHTEDSGDWINFEVRDNGIGMSKEQMNKLFQYFTQADPSTTRQYGGTGLGLAISQRFCRMMGGDINVESELDHGSVFTIRLRAVTRPAASDILVEYGEAPPYRKLAVVPEQTQVTEDQQTERRKQPSTVLVIDDDPAMLEMTERFLGKAGFRVESASDGRAGLRAARALEVNVIVLDVMIPGMDGWAVLSALKQDQKLATIPVIMLSVVDDKSKGYALGATDYLMKPVNGKTLIAVVKNVVRAPVAENRSHFGGRG